MSCSPQLLVIQSAVALRVGAAVHEACGEVVDVAPMIGWLLDLVAQLAKDLMEQCWQPVTFAALHAGVDGLGRKLPSTAAVSAPSIPYQPGNRASA